jgi:hypothetical protein
VIRDIVTGVANAPTYGAAVHAVYNVLDFHQVELTAPRGVHRNRHMTSALARAIQVWRRANPGGTQQEAADFFGVHQGRVSEVWAGKLVWPGRARRPG